ncbi:hypothetical protein ACTD5D_22515 [Nocardia takedensis]|uniref:hypothetical protein n=1 Tax=Nocardia takedensis TaxID=259390 RepID=UPI003F763705
MTGPDNLAIPDTATSSAAWDVASAYQSPALLNHSRRVYVWAATYGTDHSALWEKSGIQRATASTRW